MRTTCRAAGEPALTPINGSMMARKPGRHTSGLSRVTVSYRSKLTGHERHHEKEKTRLRSRARLVSGRPASLIRLAALSRADRLAHVGPRSAGGLAVFTALSTVPSGKVDRVG